MNIVKTLKSRDDLVDFLTKHDNKKGSSSNLLYSSLVDGRANYFFLLFIEPVITKINQQRLENIKFSSRKSKASLNLGKALSANNSPLSWAIVDIIARENCISFIENIVKIDEETNFYEDSCIYSCKESFPILIVNLEKCTKSNSSRLVIPTEDKGSISEVNQSVKLLDLVGLKFFVDLTIGLIVFSDNNQNSELKFCNSIFIRNEKSLFFRSKEIIEKAAIAWIQNWLIAEGNSLINIENYENRFKAFSFLESTFSSSLVFEFCRRLLDSKLFLDNENLTQCLVVYECELERLQKMRSELPSLLKSLSDVVPLTVELICCWYPCWQRYVFIFDSPFDHLRFLPFDKEHHIAAVKSVKERISKVEIG